jgi:tRNA threonylcarbamoyladenosine biosynthesis protein TsaB
MIRRTDDLAISISELAEMLEAYLGEKIYIVGDGYSVAHRELRKLGVQLCETPPLLRDENAFSVARVGYKQYLNGNVCDDKTHLPTYLRVPQAERERLEKLNNSDNKSKEI